MTRPHRIQTALSLGISLFCLCLPGGPAAAQSALPEVQVNPPEPSTPPHKIKAKNRRKSAASASPAAPASAAAAGPAAPGAVGASAMVVPSYQRFDAIRAAILPSTGANATSMSQAQIQAQPQGDDTPIEKTLLQTPGFSQDSAASGALHLRNDHANVQYRIDGVWLPDGVSGFSQM